MVQDTHGVRPAVRLERARIGCRNVEVRGDMERMENEQIKDSGGGAPMRHEWGSATSRLIRRRFALSFNRAIYDGVFIFRRIELSE